ncbi:MAG: hypothetical protein WCR31_01320 [Treponema sp.]
MTAQQLNETWKWSQDTNRIGNKQPINCGVKRYEAFNPHWNDCKFNCELDGASIATRFLRQLGDSGHFTEVGTIKNGIVSWYPAISQESPAHGRLYTENQAGWATGNTFPAR